MGNWQNTVTRYKKTPCRMATDNAEGKEKQREHIIQKANILSLQAPTPHASLVIRQGVFCTMRPSSAKGPLDECLFDKNLRTAGTVPCIKL